MSRLSKVLRALRTAVPGTRSRRVAVGLALLAVVAVGYGVYHYFSQVPEQRADDYRERAEPAAQRITSGMDDVYAAFDRFVAAYSVPHDYLEKIDDYGKLRRRVMPVLSRSDDALKSAGARIKRARKRIKEEAPTLRDVPSAFLLNGSEPIQEAREASERTMAYIRRARGYLRIFDRYVDYKRDMIELARRGWRPRPIEGLSENDSLERFTSLIRGERDFNRDLRKRLLRLKPPQDGRRMHEHTVAEINVMVDAWEDLLAATEALDIAAIERHEQDYLKQMDRFEGRAAQRWRAFIANSRLQKRSRTLGKQGHALLRRIAGLGSGDGRPRRKPRTRAPAPPGPKAPAEKQRGQPS